MNHPWLDPLFGDPAIAAVLSSEAELARMIEIEAAHSAALGATGLAAGGHDAARAIRGATIDMARLAPRLAEDGVIVPGLVAALKDAIDPSLHDALHRPMTSQDVVDTALAMAWTEIQALLCDRFAALGAALATLESTHGTRPLTGRTRMQAALPITVGHRIMGWRRGLAAAADRLSETRLGLQLGGPVGLGSGYGKAADAVRQNMAATLDLPSVSQWHSQRGNLSALAGALAEATGALGKLGQDIALMAQQGVGEVRLRTGGASSAMPHKSNPVDAELLITLGRYNAGQVGLIHQAMIHEQERSGAAWMLEWMVLPTMFSATGRATATGLDLLAKVEAMGDGASEL